MVNDRQTLDQLMERLGCIFEDPALLVTALTHRSAVNESRDRGLQDNERLEFLGDAVLDAVLSEELVRRLPSWNEGELTRARATLVHERALATLARELGLGQGLVLGRGEDRTGGRDKDSLLCDAFEAVIGAVALDRGHETCRLVIQRLFASRIRSMEDGRLVGLDPKTRLQEQCAARGTGVPTYPVLAEVGPPHHRTYTVAVQVDDNVLAVGSGPNKKQAAQRAAWAALRRLDLQIGRADG
jgi:ribonuclease-3